MLSVYSPSVSCQPVGTIFELFCCIRVLLSSGEVVLHNTGALVFTFGDTVLAAATQGKTCDHLVRGACILGSHRTVTIIETVLGRLPFPRHRTDSRLKYTPTLFVKEDICLSRNFSPGDRQWVWHTPTGWPGALKDAARDTIFALSPVWLQFTSNSQEGAYKRTWRPNFCAAARGHLQLAWLWGPSGLILAVLHNRIHLHSWKLLGEDLVSNQPESRCWLSSPLWDTDWSWHFLKYWELLNLR